MEKSVQSHVREIHTGQRRKEEMDFTAAGKDLDEDLLLPYLDF